MGSVYSVRASLLVRRGATEAQPEAHGVLEVAQRFFGRMVRGETAIYVAVYDEQADLVEAAAGGHKLRDDVFADAVFGEHAVNAANLTLDTAEARQESVGVSVGFDFSGIRFWH